MPKIRGESLVLGDEVVVRDTSNDKALVAWVRVIEGQKVQVYVERFKNTMWFDEAGKTRLGRFVLEGRV